MAGDLNREASELWNSLKPIIDKEIDARTQGVVQRRKAKVTTAPSLVTNTIGVTEPFGTEMFLPFNTNIMSASVGDFVWVEYMYGMTNAFVSMFASADDKNQYVAGNLTVGGVLDVTPRRCYAASLDAGWHRVLVFTSTDAGYRRGATGNEIVFHITRRRTNTGEETHEIKMLCQYDNVSFVGEISKSISNYQRITKIRYTYDGSNGYVDIYVAATSAHVTADFEVYCEPAYQALYTAAGLQSVAASPSGETVMTEYSFAENIPESGSGHIKQPDGTLIQWGIVSGLSFAAQNLISGTENLPVSFANTSYIVQASAITTGVNQYLFRCGAYPNTTAKFDWVLGSGDSSNITISNRAFTWTAIGRWK